MSIDWTGGLSPIKAPFLILDTEVTCLTPDVRRVLNLGLLYVQDTQTCTPDAAQDFLFNVPYDPVSWDAVTQRQAFITRFSSQPWFTSTLIEKVAAAGGSIQDLAEVPVQIRKELQPGKDRLQWLAAADVHKILPQHVATSGLNPTQTWPVVHDMLMTCVRNRIPLVGHNVYQFDLPVLQEEFIRHGLEPISRDSLTIVDTGLLVKAGQLGLRKKYTDALFYDYIRNLRRRVKWTLDGYCNTEFNLGRYGVNPGMQHKSAGYDCWVVACLLHAMGMWENSGALNGVEPGR